MKNSIGIVNLRYTLGTPTSNEEFHRNSSSEFKNKVHLSSKLMSSTNHGYFGSTPNSPNKQDFKVGPFKTNEDARTNN